MLQSARTTTNEVVKHTNMGKCDSLAQEQMQVRFINAKTRAKEVVKNTKKAN